MSPHGLHVIMSSGLCGEPYWEPSLHIRDVCLEVFASSARQTVFEALNLARSVL